MGQLPNRLTRIWLNRSSQDLIDGPSGGVVGVRPEVCVGIKSHERRGVTKGTKLLLRGLLCAD